MYCFWNEVSRVALSHFHLSQNHEKSSNSEWGLWGGGNGVIGQRSGRDCLDDWEKVLHHSLPVLSNNEQRSAGGLWPATGRENSFKQKNIWNKAGEKQRNKVLEDLNLLLVKNGKARSSSKKKKSEMTISENDHPSRFFQHESSSREPLESSQFCSLPRWNAPWVQTTWRSTLRKNEDPLPVLVF